MMYDSQRVEYFDWAISSINIILGYLLIIKNKLFSHWVASKNQGYDQLNYKKIKSIKLNSIPNLYDE